MEDIEKRLDLIKSKINSLKAPQNVKIVAVKKSLGKKSLLPTTMGLEILEKIIFKNFYPRKLT